MTREGFDYSAARPPAEVLRRHGGTFVVRYLARDWRGLTQGELAVYERAGIPVATVYQEGTSDWRLGRAEGRLQAQRARPLHAALGFPASRPIYYTVDHDARSDAELNAIGDFLAGVTEVSGQDPIGIYGSYTVIDYAHRTKAADYFWQTYAWSGGRLHPAAHLHQYENGVVLDGKYEVDRCRAYQDDFGQWPLEDEVTREEYENLLLAMFAGSERANYDTDGNRDPHTRENRLAYALWRVQQVVGDKAPSVADIAASAMTIAEGQPSEPPPAQDHTNDVSVPEHTHTPGGVQR